MRLKFLFLYLSTGIILISGTFSPFRVDAASSSSVIVSVLPQNPAPGENTNITLSSYANNLDSVAISWSVGGKVVLSGIGKKSFSLNAPAAGAQTDVIAHIEFPDGAVDIRVIIKPTVMALLWQADDSYVPPFYKGKALPTPDSAVKVVAMPEIKIGSAMLNSKNMVYTWKKDYTNNQDGSGFGKNSFTYTNDFLENSNNVSVVATTTDSKYSSEANITIGTAQPKILFYKNDPDLGTLWEESLKDGHIIPGQEILEASPYFISPKDIRIPTLVFKWFINEEQINSSVIQKNIMPLRAQIGASGTSKVRLQIESTDKLFETANKEINVNF